MRFNAKAQRFKDAKRNRPTELSFWSERRVLACDSWFSIAPLRLCVFALKELRHDFKRQPLAGGAR